MKYRVTFIVTGSAFIDVEAESKEEARKKADVEFTTPGLCHCCSNEIEMDDNGGEFYSVEEA